MSVEETSGTSFGDRLRADFTTVAWVLIPIGIGINLVGRFIVTVLGLPVFLDTIGTIMVAFLAGPWVAGLTGLLTNLVIGVTLEATSIPFGIVNAAIGVVAGLMAARGWLKTFPKAVVLTLALTVTTIITATPIATYMFGGVQGSGIDFITGFFVATGQGVLESVLTSQVIIQPLDKVVAVVVAFLLTRGVPMRYRPPFGREALP